MKLRRVCVKNFRNLRNVEIYPGEFAVIIGENNTGKSNLIHALRLLFDSHAERLRLDLSEDDINDAALADSENKFSVTVEVGDLQKHPEVEACFKERIDQDGDETFVTIAGRYEPDDDGFYAWQSLILPPEGRFNEPIPMSRRMARAIPLYFLDAVRDASRDTRATGRGMLSRLIDEVDYSDVQDEVQDHIRRANSALNQGEDVSTLAGGISDQLTPLVPGGQGDVVISVADEEISHLARNFRLNIRRGTDSRQFDILRHGTGLQDLTLMAMFRHRVASESKSQAILTIEEPGAHLHPHAQRRLFKDLVEMDTPVLLSTHSPIIVKHSDPSNLILLRSDTASETNAYQLDVDKADDGEDDDYLKDLALLMRGGRAELFFSRAIIIIEGESELIALPSFAEVLGCDLDRDGISLVSAQGNNYAFILRACHPDQFAIPTIVTYDTDTLNYNPDVVRQAKDAGLVDHETYQSCREDRPDVAVDRKMVLDNIGWIGATECFEEEVCRAGYLDTAIQAIEDTSHPLALQRYLDENGLDRDINGIVSCIKDRKNYKVPVARAVAYAAQDIGRVPDCYARAIRKAVLVSMGGVPVDEHFERRVCEAGYLNLILDMIDSEGVRGALEQFQRREQIEKQTIAVARFLTETETGIDLRDHVKAVVASAVEDTGCEQYARDIRQSELSDLPTE